MADSTDFDIKGITRLVDPLMTDLGFELVDIETASEHGRWILRILADKEGGITLDDCALLNRQVGAVLDIKGIISGKYVLEVSSPGLNRPLKKEKDFLNALDKNVKIKMVSAIKGRRRFTGCLRRFHDGILTLEVDDEQVLLLWKDVEKAKLVYDFDTPVKRK